MNVPQGPSRCSSDPWCGVGRLNVLQGQTPHKPVFPCTTFTRPTGVTAAGATVALMVAIMVGIAR